MNDSGSKCYDLDVRYWTILKVDVPMYYCRRDHSRMMPSSDCSNVPINCGPPNLACELSRRVWTRLWDRVSKRTMSVHGIFGVGIDNSYGTITN